MRAMNECRRLGFLLSLLSAACGFVANPVFRSPGLTGTTERSAVSSNIGVLAPFQINNFNFNDAWEMMPLEIEPSVSAISISYPIEEVAKSREFGKKWKKALGGATAVACASLLAKTLTVNSAAIMAGLSLFFVNYPMHAAVTICSLNSFTADIIGQFMALKEGAGDAFQIKRTISAVAYGIYMGFCSNLAYTKLIPTVCGINAFASAFFDNLVLAPMLWLPPAYLIKSFFFDTTPKEAWKNYLVDVKGGLLKTYWSLWIPAQLFSFSFVPKQGRVACMAACSFCWFLILSSLTSKKQDATA